ncbi:hypothetical protein CLU79DRAFT_773837 [Phycomyces nitens]|nr:hypothetical protein CLU79DRAFT_773837 [Phycomyces nitens]
MLIQSPFSLSFIVAVFPVYFFNTRQRASYNVVDSNEDYFSSTQSTESIFCL